MLIETASQLYAGEDLGMELDQTVYAFDSTTIDLCLSAFPWAKFRKGTSAVRPHSALDLRGNIPVVISITSGKILHVNALDDLLLEAGCLYLRSGHVDFARLYRLHLAQSFYVIRAKSNFVFKR